MILDSRKPSRGIKIFAEAEIVDTGIKPGHAMDNIMLVRVLRLIW